MLAGLRLAGGASGRAAPLGLPQEVVVTPDEGHEEPVVVHGMTRLPVAAFPREGRHEATSRYAGAPPDGSASRAPTARGS